MFDPDKCISCDSQSLSSFFVTESDSFAGQKKKKANKNKKEIRLKEGRHKDEDKNSANRLQDEPMDSFLDLFDPSWEDKNTVEDVNGNFMFKNDTSNILDELSSSAESEDQENNFLNCATPCPSSPTLPDQLPSEPQEGNIEYKLKLLNPNDERFKRLVSQMQWRLREGLGEAIYEIGVEDSGYLIGLSRPELAASMATLKRMANQLGASLTTIRDKTVLSKSGHVRKVAEVLVKKVPDDQISVEVRIAVLGSSDVGKSTLLGVLTRGELDNGRGGARLNVFRHRHEVYSGKTSSISLQMMGFDAKGSALGEWMVGGGEELCSRARKMVLLIDLAGDPKYIRTTAFGLSAYAPHLAVVVVSAVCGVSECTEEHLSMAAEVEVPMAVVVTKVDVASPQQMADTVAHLTHLLRQSKYNKNTFVIETLEDAFRAGQTVTSWSPVEGAPTPIFCLSSVTGVGLHLLKQFLFHLKPTPVDYTTRDFGLDRRKKSYRSDGFTSSESSEDRSDDPEAQFEEGRASPCGELDPTLTEFSVDEVYCVDNFRVVAGLLLKGEVSLGSRLQLGPFNDGSFAKVVIRSIHRNRVPGAVVRAGQSASLGVVPAEIATSLGRRSDGTEGKLPGRLRKGMKLIHEDAKPKSCTYFQARLRVSLNGCGVWRGSHVTLHIGSVRQTAVVVAIMGLHYLRPAQTGSVILRFLRRPECISAGDKVLFRSSDACRGSGYVLQMFTEESSENTALQ